MLIKSSRIRTASGAAPLLRHLGNAEDNEQVIAVQGTGQDLRDAVADAKRFGRTYCLRHWIIAPQIAIDTDKFRQCAQAITDEFGFDINAAFIVEHQKTRAVDNAAKRHWHVVVPEVDPISGRVLDNRNDYARHEKIARILETEFGHPITAGRHDKAVIASLRADGLNDVADHVAALTAASARPNAAYTTVQHQSAKRHGLDLPLLKGHIAAAWAATETGHDFAARLDAHGLEIVPGDKDGVWIIRARDGTFVGAAHRLARVRRAEFSNRMESINEHAAKARSPVDPRRYPADQGADRNHSGTRAHGGDADGGRTGLVHGNGGEAVGHDRERRGGEPEEFGSVAPTVRRTRDRGNVASYDGRGLIASIQSAGRDLAELARPPFGEGYDDRVENAIIEVERAAQSRIDAARMGMEVPRTKLDAMINFEASARKAADDLVAQLRALESSPDPKPPSWIDRLCGRADPNAAQRSAEKIAACRKEVIAAERVLASAVSAVARAEKDYRQAQVAARTKVEGVVKEARIAQDQVRLIRHVTARYPRLVYSGPAFVSWAGGKIYRARKRYSLINPHAKTIWGLPIDPGY